MGPWTDGAQPRLSKRLLVGACLALVAVVVAVLATSWTLRAKQVRADDFPFQAIGTWNQTVHTPFGDEPTQVSVHADVLPSSGGSGTVFGGTIGAEHDSLCDRAIYVPVEVHARHALRGHLGADGEQLVRLHHQGVHLRLQRQPERVHRPPPARHPQQRRQWLPCVWHDRSPGS